MQSHADLKTPEDVKLEVKSEQLENQATVAPLDVKSEQPENQAQVAPFEIEDAELEIEEEDEPLQNSVCHSTCHGIKSLATSTLGGLGTAVGGNLSFQVFKSAIQFFNEADSDLRVYGFFFLTLGTGLAMMTGMMCGSSICNLRESFNHFRTGYRTFFNRTNTYDSLNLQDTPTQSLNASKAAI